MSCEEEGARNLIFSGQDEGRQQLPAVVRAAEKPSLMMLRVHPSCPRPPSIPSTPPTEILRLLRYSDYFPMASLNECTNSFFISDSFIVSAIDSHSHIAM